MHVTKCSEWHRDKLMELQEAAAEERYYMKKLRIKYNLYIVLAIAICIAPFLCMSFARTDETAEKKTLAARPTFLDPSGKITLDYLPKMGEYFEDHFAFKEVLVSINAHIHAALFDVSSEESVILGKDGWLFYSATEDDFCHNNSVTERELYAMAHNVKLMQDYCEQYDKEFIFTIAPNKNSLYPENMPDRYKYRVADKSDAKRLKPYLESEGVHYVDLFELFDAQDEVLYLKQDSHWNNKGARLVYNTLLDEAGISHERFVNVDDTGAEIQENVNRENGDAAENATGDSDFAVGDLAGMVYSVSAKPEYNPTYVEEDCYEMVEGSSVEDMIVRTVSNEAAGGSLLMYRDSFGNSLISFFAKAARDAYFSKVVPYPLSDIFETEADIVIVEKVERHLPTLAEVAPIMDAPRIESVDCYDENFGDLTELNKDVYEFTMSETEDYCIIKGRVSGAKLDTCTRIFVGICEDGVDADEDTDYAGYGGIYEAFLISGSEGEDMHDQGFEVNIPTEYEVDESDIAVYVL